MNHLWKTKNSNISHLNLAKSSVGIRPYKSPESKKLANSSNFDQGVETRSDFQANPLKRTAPLTHNKDMFYRPAHFEKYQKL